MKRLIVRVSSFFTSFKMVGGVVKQHPFIVATIGICLLSLAVWRIATLYIIPEVGSEVGNRAPDFTLPTIDGESVTLSDFRGKAVILYLWTPQCAACVAEMPHIQAFLEKWAKRDLVVLAINIESEPKTANDFIASQGFTFPMLIDSEMTFHQDYKLPQPLPVTIFIDTRGIIQKVRPGTFGGQRQLENIVNSIESNQPIEMVPPLISNVSISSVTKSTAIVSWTTDEPATSQVTYLQLNGAHLRVWSDSDEGLVIEHSLTLGDLDPDTTYSLSVVSHDAFGNGAKRDAGTFTTLTPVPIGTEIGNRAPDFTLQTIDGESVTLSNFRGKIAMVHFWWSGCAACEIEMPHIQSVFENWSDEELAILAINVRESAATVQSFIDSLGLTFPMLLDSEGEVDKVYKPQFFPTTFFIDAEGIIRGIKKESFHSAEEIESVLKSL